MVNEVDLEGNVVRLESLQVVPVPVPVPKVDGGVDAAVQVVVSAEDSLRQLGNLVGQEKLAAWEEFVSDTSVANATFKTEVRGRRIRVLSSLINTLLSILLRCPLSAVPSPPPSLHPFPSNHPVLARHGQGGTQEDPWVLQAPLSANI